MLDQNFQTDEDQYDTTGDLSIFSKFSTDFISQENRDAADDKCGDADETEAGMMSTFRNAKLIPTARASMLVATASSRIFFAGIESTSVSHSASASLIPESY